MWNDHAVRVDDPRDLCITLLTACRQDIADQWTIIGLEIDWVESRLFARFDAHRLPSRTKLTAVDKSFEIGRSGSEERDHLSST
jgi:hypothetical protein